MTLEQKIIELLETEGFKNDDVPCWIPDIDNKNGTPLHQIVCSNCSANGYYASEWEKSGRSAWLNWCDHCGYRWIEIDL